MDNQILLLRTLPVSVIIANRFILDTVYKTKLKEPKMIKAFILTFIMILTFCATDLAQNSRSRAVARAKAIEKGDPERALEDR